MFKLWLETIENLQIIGPMPHTDNDLAIHKTGSLLWQAVINTDKDYWGVFPDCEQRNQIGYLLAEPTDKYNYYVGEVHVHPDFQRQGISSKLHDIAFVYFKEHDIVFHSGMLTPTNLLYWQKLEKEGRAKQSSGIGGSRFVRIS